MVKVYVLQFITSAHACLQFRRGSSAPIYSTYISWEDYLISENPRLISESTSFREELGSRWHLWMNFSLSLLIDLLYVFWSSLIFADLLIFPLWSTTWFVNRAVLVSILEEDFIHGWMQTSIGLMESVRTCDEFCVDGGRWSQHIDGHTTQIFN